MFNASNFSKGKAFAARRWTIQGNVHALSIPLRRDISWDIVGEADNVEQTDHFREARRRWWRTDADGGANGGAKHIRRDGTQRRRDTRGCLRGARECTHTVVKIFRSPPSFY